MTQGVNECTRVGRVFAGASGPGEVDTRLKSVGKPLSWIAGWSESVIAHPLREHAARCMRTNHERAEHAWAPIGQKRETKRDKKRRDRPLTLTNDIKARFQRILETKKIRNLRKYCH